MCGIAGIIGRVDEVHRAALKRMSDAMAHRGPDAEGTWCSTPDARGFGALLAHRRLSILDLSPAGAQPMVDPVTGSVFVFNGEIYNYLSLRNRLVAAGQEFQSTGDTAVVLRMLALEGAPAVNALRGMFAFALFDPRTRNLLVARDPLGIKPLYLARNPDPHGEWSLAFASEVRTLLASGLLPQRRLNPRAVASVVWNGFVAGPDTAVEGIESLGPGQLRVYDGAGGAARDELFWSMGCSPGKPRVDEPELDRVLRDCVHLHLASDVPLAVFLSSGIDSSAVANLARKSSSGAVHTFTLAFDEPEFDESPLSREIARSIGTQHRQVTLTEAAFVGQLDRALDSLDQPTFDGLNTYYMSHAVREAGFKVALVGTGGDELFGGYTSFRDLPALRAWSHRTRLVPDALRAGAARLLLAALHGRRRFPPQTRWAKLPHMVARGEDLIALYQLAYALFLPDFQEKLLTRGLGRELEDGLPPALRERLALETEARSPLSAISVMEQRLFLGERLLRDSDAASMSASIELRLPLVDQELFEHVDRMEDGVRYRPVRRKAVLRRLGLAGLDPALFERPKRGFVLPFDRWIRRSLGPAMDAALRDPTAIAPTGLDPVAVERLWTAFQASAPGVYWSRIWTIFVLIRWCNRHRIHL